MDDLHKPLGLGKRPRATRMEIPYGLIAVAGCCFLVASLGLFTFLTDDKFGGEPYAISRIELAPPPVPAPPPVKLDASSVKGDDATGSVTSLARSTSADELEQMSGVKVTRMGGVKAPGALVIEIPDRGGVQLNPAPDKRLIETTKLGLLPKAGADGSKPLLIYARPAMTSARLKVGAPRIALVFGGLGLAESQTSDAIDKLPGEVTLAFAPYGKGLERQVSLARDAGHEVLLQVPMQSFDYPANNPGPETLLSDADETANLAHLRVLMGKFAGYVGLMTYQGGKFTADNAALAPILRETAARGLMMLDDGSSPRSLISAIAPQFGTPFVRGDLTLDVPPKSEAIAAALTKLEARARETGNAVGIADGYPAAIDQIALWAKGLEARGIALVPVSAMIGKGTKTVAEQVQ